MATVKSTLSLEDKMSSTLKAIQAASKQTESRFDALDDKLRKLSNSANSTGSVLKGVLGANLIQKGVQMVMGQLDDAISRFDTLNNYTNVMEGLGFGADESQASIDRLKDGLDGLPTTLDDAVSSVQRFAAVNENIGASTEMTLALNDALAAGGTPAATQAAALEQISQAYAKGKFDAMEYKSMMNAMPAQLKQVAQEMGYTSTALGGDFYNALQKGEIGMNSMMNTMIKLDKQTGGFHDQALKATNGIGTAFTNMKTAITKGLTSLIENINNALERAGLPTIQEMIKNVGKTAQEVLSKIGEIIGGLLEFMAPVFKFIADNANVIIISLGILIGLYAAWKVATEAMTIAQWLLNAAMDANPIGLIIILVAALIIMIVILWEKCEGFRQFVGNMMASNMKAVAGAYNLVAKVYNKIQDILQNMTDASYTACAAMIDYFANTAVSFVKSGNGIIGILKKVIDIYNSIASTVGGTTINADALISEESIEALRTSAKDALTAMTPTFYDRMEEVDMDKLTEKTDAMAEKISNFTLSGLLAEKLGDVNKTIKDNAIDTNSFLEDVTAPAGSGGSGGGKALKTTTSDKLLEDEDIQLLLDIATRDYKLSYQQVTPNITLTFGDIRETADVDDILDQVADRLEEIYDSNLEVPVG